MNNVEIERKFLIERGLAPEDPVHRVSKIGIIQTYLLSSMRYSSRRVRSLHRLPPVDADTILEYGVSIDDLLLAACPSYTYAKKRRITDRSREELELSISVNEYYKRLGNEVDPKIHPIYKLRDVFYWNGLIWELDTFYRPDKIRGLRILEVELDREDRAIELPAFLGICRDVTRDPLFTNKSLAKRSR